MLCYHFVIFTVLTTFATSQKNHLETLNNYSEFLNFGEKKLMKLKKDSLENAIIKSKVDVLGEIFKENIGILKASGKLDLIFLIDASSSVGETNFKSELKFVKKLLSDVTVDYNHTRIAVVTFSSSVVQNIDEISKPNSDNNKCLLLNKQLNNIRYTGGGTYTSEAFKVAQEIFQVGRNESRKVLILITDGFSNGGDPVPFANELKKNHVTIFTIGIQNGNYKELYELASSPGELHSYLLDSFQEFESLARRALHVDLKIGNYIPLGINGPCDSLCDEGDCCDKNALCACGTSTGHYACVCRLGYYGSGLNNSCQPCPSGTYSNGPNLCLPCPDVQHITEPPALNVESCKCKTGYQPTVNNHCEILKCPKISAPEHGYFVKKRDCGNVLNSACGIRCEVGYTLVGSSIRLCQTDSQWSGDEPSCQVKTCSKLDPPLFGSMLCYHSDLGIKYNETQEDLPVDTVCSFTCENGKTLIGSSLRTCLPLARWDGLKASCKQIKCPKLPPIRNAKFDPKSCSFGKQPYGKKCKIVCDEGFKLEGLEEKTCTGNHGLWNSKFEESSCKDEIPPKMLCPKNVTTTTHLGEKYGSTSWMYPLVTDNGEEISIWMKPSIRNVTNFKFHVGETKVTYFAQDSYHNRAKCSFYVIVKDEEKPVIEGCEDPPTFLTSAKEGANITWDEPHIFDNSQHVKVIKSHKFGIFPIGTTTVTYTATDNSNNTNECSLNVTVEDAHCDALPDPSFGQSDCGNQEDGMQCVITCQEGYAIPLFQYDDGNASSSFLCNHSDPVWKNEDDFILPECSITEIPKTMEQNGTVTVPSNLDVCNSTEIDDIENDIKAQLEESACTENCTIQTAVSCEDDKEDTEEKTNIIKREAPFEEVPHRNQRKKTKKKRINVKFQVRGQQITPSDNVTLNNQTLHVHNQKLNFICPVGFVPRKNRCVQCPKGAFHNMTKNRCQSCPFGTYNENLSQTICKTCPLHHSTRRAHSKKLQDCKEECPPGTHARLKTMKLSKRHPSVTIERATLKPHCRSCKVGFYQNEYGQLHCHPCPKGHTTLTFGSVNFSQCILKGSEICDSFPSICNKGKCMVDDDLHYSCDCPNNYVGAHCEKQLTKCDSNPCLNDGLCKPTENNFICTCAKGYTGRSCETRVEKCLLICLNGGTCLQNDENDYLCLCPTGFGGDACQIKLDYCQENFCENNATCVSEANSFRCVCPKGLIGRRCNLLPCDYRPCKGNAICLNKMDENATRDSYSCVCPEGYTGNLCEARIDFCAYSPCLNGGSCFSNFTTYSCICPKLYAGDRCEIPKTTKYILNFKKVSTTDYVKMKGFDENLNEITACLWMKTIDNFNYGTLLSYATKVHDNAFTLTDYTGLVLYINNNPIVTDILLNDGFWHHVCISWENSKGTYKLYVDNKAIKNGDGLAVNTTIEGDGNMVIGQEQDILGGRFSQSETFIGKIANFDVWSKELSHEEITAHMNDCLDSMIGDVYGWPDVQDNVLGNVLIENSTFCSKCDYPKPLYNGVINVAENVAYYQCYEGFYLSSNAFSEGRKCTKTGRWEGQYEPYCKKAYCGYPGHVRNGYMIGTKFYHRDKVTYKCFDDFEIIGNSTLICSENGTWSSEKPRCSGLQCTAFKKPENSNLTIMAEHSYEDFIENQSIFDVGTQIEIVCGQNATLDGENVITCEENGTWDFPPPKCVQPLSTTSSCALDKVPLAPSNGYIVLESLYAAGNGSDNIVEYKCINGYKLNGDNSTTCIIDGYWTQPNISCDAIMCPHPKFKSMVIMEDSENQVYFFGYMIKFDCVEGYKMFGDNSIRCLANGRWTRMRGKCLKRSCRKPQVNEATIIEGNSYLYEDQVTLICANKKQYIMTCNSYGMWIGDKDDSC